MQSVYKDYTLQSLLSSRGYSCLYEKANDEKIVQIPYENDEDDWLIKLYKML